MWARIEKEGRNKMKIVCAEQKVKSFESLEVGTVFQTEIGTAFYLKISNCFENETNSFCLTTNSPRYFVRSLECRIVNCELVVK